MHQLIVTHFKTRRVGIPALFRLFLAFFNALANEDHSSRSHLDQIRVDRADKVHYVARSLRVLANCTIFSTAQPRLRCMQNVRQSVLYAKARQGPGLPRYISVGSIPPWCVM